MYEGVKTLGIGAEISAAIAESEAFDYLDAPIIRLGGSICEFLIVRSSRRPRFRRPRTSSQPPASSRWDASTWRVEVILPRVDMDMTTGKIAKWFVAEGETVARGEALFEIELDKAAMEIEVPAAGVLSGVTGRPGDELPVGTVVGWIVAPGETFAEPKPATAGVPVARDPEPTPSAWANDKPGRRS